MKYRSWPSQQMMAAILDLQYWIRRSESLCFIRMSRQEARPTLMGGNAFDNLFSTCQIIFFGWHYSVHRL